MPQRYLWPFTILSFFAVSMLFAWHYSSALTDAVATGLPSIASSPPVLPLPVYNLPQEVYKNLGPYSPRYPLEEDEFIADSPPSSLFSKGCSVTQVNLLQRHGARFPTSSAGLKIEQVIARIRLALQNDINSIDPTLSWLNSYSYSYVGEQLVDFGREQAFLTGRNFYVRYGHLGSSPFVRSPQKSRLSESGRWFKHGFESASRSKRSRVKFRPEDISSLPKNDVEIPIGVDSNNTLSQRTCAAATSWKPETKPHLTFLAQSFPPIAAHLSAHFNLPGLNFTEKETLTLMSLCGFESAASMTGTGKRAGASRWCSLFEEEDWKSFEYYWDLQKYYVFSYGDPYARTLGSGWVNELVARLQERIPQQGWPIGPLNTTLDSAWDTFPIGKGAPTIFADFTSDNSILPILAALSLLKPPSDLPSSHAPLESAFPVSQITPFAGNLIVERLTCRDPSSWTPRFYRKDSRWTDYVRVLVNDAPVPLQDCGPEGAERGICKLDTWIKNQAFSTDGGEWEKCYQ